MSHRYRWDLLGENIKSNSRVVKQTRFRSWSWPVLLLVFSFSVLLSRAAFLQVVMGGELTKRADENRMELLVVKPDRGVVLDRNGVVVARNGLNEADKIVREYPYGEALSGVLGYLSDGEGKAGVEKSFEEKLRGIPGEDLEEENAKGETLKIIRQKEPVSGSEVRLTLEVGLNKRILEILNERNSDDGVPGVKGAVIVSRIQTGEILALMSYPTYDDNLFSGLAPEMDDYYQSVNQVLNDQKGKPMFNRAIAGAYPPGSIFKLITAVAGLEEGVINKDTTVDDTGELKVGIYRYGNWYFDQYGRTEGVIGLKRALARSNDIFFYKVGEWLTIDKLSIWARKIGLGEKTEINLPGEVDGTIPDRLEKERLTGERWFLGNTYHAAIGQGDILATPLQMNLATARVISGKKCQPKLELLSDDDCSDLGIKSESRQIIIEGMREACESGGTAFPFFDAPYERVCKTGTAQHGGEETLPHAWITVVLPTTMNTNEHQSAPINTNNRSYENGVVLTVLLEEAGEGSAEAGAVARRIADYLVEHQSQIGW